MYNKNRRVQTYSYLVPANQTSEAIYFRNLFLAALAASLLLMASGLFIGTIGIDDELTALSTAFDGTGRGLWVQHLVTLLLPGRLGVTFAPAAIGCGLYAISTAIVVYLWGPIKKKMGYISAALIGGFPYFASMMTFDVVQVAYPLGFVLIASCLMPIFNSRKLVTVGLSILAFAIAFACYQGVSATFAAAWASIVGMRYLLTNEKNVYLKELLRVVIPRTIATVGIGSLFYLLTVKISQVIIPHAEWGEGYQVKTSFFLSDPTRLPQIIDNATALFTGRSGDLPYVTFVILALGVFAVCLSLIAEKGVAWQIRVFAAPLFVVSVVALPFWMQLVQSMPLTPRSAVGLGIFYGYIFAALATRVNRWAKYFLVGCAGVVLVQFIFTGNQMYYSQFLASQADQLTVARVSARIDAVVSQHHLKNPVRTTFIGSYTPANSQFAKYSTIGSSPLKWDNGNIVRQAALFEFYGVDGIYIERDPSLREEITNQVVSKKIPGWPDAGSVFLYKGDLVVVNFGNI